MNLRVSNLNIKLLAYGNGTTEKELHKKLGKDMRLIIKFVDRIPRTQRGKYRFLIQKLTVEFGDK